jgi:ADP-ribose pyrophosphatase YjhB (NUDIX family)
MFTLIKKSCNQPTIHTNCISSKYLEVSPRFLVDPRYNAWSTKYDDYNPIEYNRPSYTSDKPPVWADPLDPTTIDWTEKTRTIYGKFNFTPDGRPINPIGRTGLIGRGVLGKWGPNTAADSLFTRFKREGDKVVYIDGTPILQLVAIEREDGGDGIGRSFALPGGMVENDDLISTTAAKEFTEEALAGLAESEKKTIIVYLDDLIRKNGYVVYGDPELGGYVDDRRNTDNSWMVTKCYHVHDSDNNIFNNFKLEGGDDAKHAFWLDYHPSYTNFKLYATHADWVKHAYSNLTHVA